MSHQIQNRDHARGKVHLNSDERAMKILKGFKLIDMKIRDAENGEKYWQSDDNWSEVFEKEQKARLPSKILKSAAVARSITFSSIEMIIDFRLEQNVFFQGQPLERWSFRFGFVMPNSTNSWESTIEAAPEAKMMPPDLLSGNVVIETSFYDGDMFLSKSVVRVFYTS